MPCICIVPAVEGIGGMATFRHRFEAGLARRGIAVTHDTRSRCDALLVIAGTRHLGALLRARRRGIRIVQRLDGINWIQRRRYTGARHFVRAEYGNLILWLIRGRLAAHILYQSQFTRAWWNDWYGKPAAASSVVHNGVPLDEFNPQGERRPAGAGHRLLVVEGSLGGGYGMGLENAVHLAQQLQHQHGLPIELMVVGKLDPSHQAALARRASIPIVWEGAVPRDRIPEIDRSAQLLFSADLNPACPNAVIEALACGLPVAAFDTGALPELVRGDAGRLVPYGGDPWRLEQPDIPALARAAAEILRDQDRFRVAARTHAEQELGFERMLDGYLKVLLEG